MGAVAENLLKSLIDTFTPAIVLKRPFKPSPVLLLNINQVFSDKSATLCKDFERLLSQVFRSVLSLRLILNPFVRQTTGGSLVIG